MFLRGKRFLAGRIPRVGIKGEGPRKADSTETVPNFYRMTSLPPFETKSNDNMSLAAHGPISAHLRSLLAASTTTTTPQQTMTNHRSTEMATVNSPSDAEAPVPISQAPSSSLFNEPPHVVNGSSLWPCLDASSNPHWGTATLNYYAGRRLGTMPAVPPLAPPPPLTADQSLLWQVIANRRRADSATAAATYPFWLEQQQHQQQALLSELYPNNSPRYPNNDGWPPGWFDPRNARHWP
jgi:hypothetical protein